MYLHQSKIIPFIVIKMKSKVKGKRKQPRITMHSNQRNPILAANVIPCKIDFKSWLREICWNFL